MRRPPARTIGWACRAAVTRRARTKVRNLMAKAYITGMRTLLIVPFAILLAACATARGPLDLEHAQIVDLTHPFDEHTLYWPSSPSAFELKQLAHGATPAGY